MEGFARSLAFLVAIDRYQGGVPELRTPVSDAEELADVLHRDHGFETEVCANEKATLADLRTMLTGLPDRVGADDRVIFYFAGHGIALDGDDGPKGFVLPQDAERDSTAKYLPMAELDEKLSALPCRHMLVVLDCCFAGAFRWASFRHLVLAPQNLHRERYEWFIQDAAWQAIASAAHDQKALDVAGEQPLGKRDDDREHSPFAGALIRGLQGAADRAAAGGTGDGVITATELYLYLEDELLPKGNDSPRQTPMLWPLRKHDKGQFVFLVPGRELTLPDAPPLDVDANPWRGLEPYEARHAELFFGRRDASKKLVERVRNERFVAVIGPSGIGKSSLVRAGLLPGLDTELLQPVVIRPGSTPFASLARALRDAMPEGSDTPAEADLATDRSALAQWTGARPGPGELLLVVDQAEELITMSRDDDVAKGFLGLIAHALDGTGEHLRVVFTVRSEFEPQFAQSPLKDHWPQARFLVPPMTQDELRRVIEGPAAIKVMRFESSELTERLVNEVVQMPGALPLLSFALSQMYAHYLTRRGTDRALTEADYDALEGGVTGSLRVRANQVVDGVDEAHQATARRVLERLVSVETGEYARRRVPRREFKADNATEQARIDHILTRLDEARLVVTDEVDGQAYLELAHDALILGWDRLLTWIRQDAPLIADLRRLTTDAEAWNSPKSQKAGLLWSDPARLAAVKQLQAADAPGLNENEKLFAIASVRRAKRNRKIRTLVATSLFVLAVGASIFAYLSEQQRIRSEANRLALAARLAARTDLSLILAAASAKLRSNFEAESSLFFTLTKRPHLRRMFHGANGTVTNINMLPNGRLIIRSGIDSGSLMSWGPHEYDTGHPVPGVKTGFDQYLVFPQASQLVILRNEIIEFYTFKEPFHTATFIGNLRVSNVNNVFAGEKGKFVYATVGNSNIVVININKMAIDSSIPLPRQNTDAGTISVGPNQELAFQSPDGVWLRLGAGWTRLQGPPATGYKFVGLQFDAPRNQLISALGIDENVEAAPITASPEGGFRCWDLGLGTVEASKSCPPLGPLAQPAELGYVTADTVFYSTRDLKTGYDSTEYQFRQGPSWTHEILRIDPTFVTSLAVNDVRKSLFIGTIDGEIGEYDIDQFAAGSEYYTNTDGETFYATWSGGACAIAVLNDNTLKLVPCVNKPGGSPIMRKNLGSGNFSRPEVTGDGSHVYAINKRGQLVLWSSDLSSSVDIEQEPGSELSSVKSVAYDEASQKVYMVFGGSHKISRFDVASSTWMTFADLPFDIGGLTVSPDGNTIYAGSDTNGDVVGFDTNSFKAIFRQSIPAAQFIQFFTASSEKLFVSALTGQHSVYILDAHSGAILSGNLNRFSGPAKVLAVSRDGHWLVMEGVGFPEGQIGKRNGAEFGTGIEIWDTTNLLPLSDGILTRHYGWDHAAFSPDGSTLGLIVDSPIRTIMLPLSLSKWLQAACTAVGRDLLPEERTRFSVPADSVCDAFPTR